MPSKISSPHDISHFFVVEYTSRSVGFGRCSGFSTVVLSRQFSPTFAAFFPVDFLELVMPLLSVFVALKSASLRGLIANCLTSFKPSIMMESPCV